MFWHGQQLFMPWLYRIRDKKNQKPFYAIVSKHNDGRLCASLIQRLSMKSIAGSSSNGGSGAFKEMYRKVISGCHMAITPDGPKGPVEEVKLGAVKLASLTNAKIVPVAFHATKKWTFNSWDSIFIPKPFSKTYMFMGEGFYVSKNISKAELVLESKNLELELKRLNNIVQLELN